jgi:hypothetical protein
MDPPFLISEIEGNELSELGSLQALRILKV